MLIFKEKQREKKRKTEGERGKILISKCLLLLLWFSKAYIKYNMNRKATGWSVSTGFMVLKPQINCCVGKTDRLIIKLAYSIVMEIYCMIQYVTLNRDNSTFTFSVRICGWLSAWLLQGADWKKDAKMEQRNWQKEKDNKLKIAFRK